MRNKVGKLLAVALATATPAAAGPSHAVHEAAHAAPAAPADPWKPVPTVTTVPPNMPAEFRAAQAELLAQGVLAVIGVRTLKSGAPACGNVQSKVRRPCEPVRTAQNTENK